MQTGFYFEVPLSQLQRHTVESYETLEYVSENKPTGQIICKHTLKLCMYFYASDVGFFFFINDLSLLPAESLSFRQSLIVFCAVFCINVLNLSHKTARHCHISFPVLFRVLSFRLWK